MNWSQLRTILWLRWRLTRNQFARGGRLNVILSVIVLVVGLLLAIGAGVGGVFGGALGLSVAPPLVSLLVWDVIVAVFLFMWMIGVLTELQRSEAIDLARLLHLPVSLPGIFTMNFVASLLTPGIIIFLPAAAGLSLGLMWGKGLLMALLLPLILGFLFMVTAWTYCLRGWLIALMVNPRQRRNVVMIGTLAVVLGSQLPNVYIQFFARRQWQHAQQERNRVNEDIQRLQQELKDRRDNPAAHPHDPKAPAPRPPVAERDNATLRSYVPWWVLPAHNYVPVLWLPKGALGLAEGDAWPAVLGALGGLLLGAAGLARAYRSTLRFYLGQDTDASARQAARAKVPGRARKNFLEKRVPFVSETVAALSLAFFRSLSRAPEVKMALFSNLIVVVAVLPILFLTSFKTPGETAQLFIATGIVGFTFLGLLVQMFNVFGFDREGFRALVLSPARRRDVLLAKNLALAPVALGIGFAMLLVLRFLVHLSLALVAAGMFKLTAMFLLLSVAGNWTSIWVPYRITAGSLKPTKPPLKTILLILATQLLLPVVMLPIFIPPLLGLVLGKLGWWPAPLVDALLSVGLIGVAAPVYWFSLRELGQMLEDREQKILLVVSQAGE